MFRKVFASGKDQRNKQKRREHEKLITASGLFDADWYVDTYPDASGYKGGALGHFLDLGAAEGRSAGPAFDTHAYLNANADVAASGSNPLVHYIQYGLREKRSFFAAARPAPPPSVSFSLIVVGGNPADLRATFGSLAALRGARFEVVLAASAATTFEPQQGRKAPPVRTVAPADEGRFLAEAIKAARNDFVIVLDAGDLVDEAALVELSKVILTGSCDVVYCDERQSRTKLSKGDAVLKPGWSPELLSAFNYFGRLTAIRRSVALTALPAAGTDAAAEWDLNLRVTERTGAIAHLAAILCRRPALGAKDGRLPGRDASAHEGVLKAHWSRKGRDAVVSTAPDGTFRATWSLAERPLVSIIIPNKNRAHLLRMCTEGLYEKTAYDNFELIVVDNGSTEPETLALYDELRARSARIIPFEETFNYSRACNLGAAEARGAFLLFLNNDIEVVQPEWLDELVRQASEPGIGVVGAKLLYPDGGIQHAGVALGLFTLAAHVFHRAPENAWGPIGSPSTTRNWLAVTGACQLMRREIFDLVGGYDEDFIISFSDVVLCMSAVRAGFRTVYQPSALLVHHEGASRGRTNPLSDQIQFARSIRALGFAEDPYFHRDIETDSFVPVLREATNMAGDGPTPLQLGVERLAGPPGEVLDVFDDGAVASAAQIPWGDATWHFDPAGLKPGTEAGARIVLELLRRRRDLRASYPRALLDGPGGGFASWAKTDGLRLLGLPPDYAAWIDVAFDADLGGAARKALSFDEALRTETPLFLLPSGAKKTSEVLFAALADSKLTRESLWWFLVENAEDAQAALCTTWAMRPDWQEAVPAGGTVFGVVDLAEWVAEEYGCSDPGIFAQTYPGIMSDAAQVRVAYAARPDWRARFPDAMSDEASARALLDHLASGASGLHFLPRTWLSERPGLARDVVRPGVNVVGHFAYLSGLRVSTESLVEGLSLNGVACSRRDVPISFKTDEAIGHRFGGLEVYDTTIVHVQPEPHFLQAFELAGLLPREKRTYRIGLWYWELDEVPASWNRAALQCDELWAATEFIGGALRKRFRQPVRVLNPGVELGPFARSPRSAFGLGDEFVFVFVFHMTSVMDRKNPLGLIQAFKSAFGEEDDARLVIKTSFGEKHPGSLAALEAAAEGAKISIINESFSRDETLSLIAAGDAYVSLHRSEGLGLTMAEAMLLGRPVVATRYSGNLDFMDDDNSLLVDYRLTSVGVDVPFYEAGGRWAEPSIAHAAQQMRRLFDDRDFARDLGERAKRDLEERLGYRHRGRAIAQRLAEIEAERKGDAAPEEPRPTRS